eukprot:TRINITY_DN9495_c0_g1_i1.p1 TRINITY_DN9495_c0_g1~~TRINITY_DN9495_c0_g1_i1.p1  ORF type:complete len:154 (+),score=30.19 TRINITY_DN9495_c0_g1_i1:60-464(+)
MCIRDRRRVHGEIICVKLSTEGEPMATFTLQNANNQNHVELNKEDHSNKVELKLGGRIGSNEIKKLSNSTLGDGLEDVLEFIFENDVMMVKILRDVMKRLSPPKNESDWYPLTSEDEICLIGAKQYTFNVLPSN